MAKIRVGRIGEQIKKELSFILQTEIKDPRVGFVTVTGVEVTNDLSQAKVYLSILGNEKEKNDSLQGLTKANGYIRSELGKRIRLRHIPELIFKIDSSIEYGNRIEEMLRDVNRDANL
ncbi:30S ribosome-binding factor RbfA [Chengkuizengella axinellae]|uniref:Ribosome-binding factor A n=1 Tax=Chengkuizengella axinellae TaxID=3064388 RepID=A0ABT9IVT8_9BACL|nr:30S ribosome-binding factor RbfA [Chengkuizengella sp. 2205SS18-9]MDP5273484.1 30S ribosome-binding factor RbfA [Chengkuizengella sp. 2205SS18-9]